MVIRVLVLVMMMGKRMVVVLTRKMLQNFKKGSRNVLLMNA